MKCSGTPADILREVEKSAAEKFGSKVNYKLTDKVKNGALTVDQGVIAGCSGGMFVIYARHRP